MKIKTMKSRAFFVVMTMVLFLTAIFVASSPVSVNAQTTSTITTNREVAKRLSFTLAVANGVQPIVAVSTIPRSFCLSSSGVGVSTLNGGSVAIISHDSSTSVCIYDLLFSFPGFTGCMVTITKAGSTADISRGTNVNGAIRAVSVKSQGIVDFNVRNPVGALKAIDASGNDISGGGSLGVLNINVNSCALTSVSIDNSFVVYTAEASTNMAVTFTTVSGCTPPGGATLNYNVAPRRITQVRLHTDCRWIFKFDDSSLACNIYAFVYRDGDITPRSVAGTRLIDQMATFNNVGSQIHYESARVNTIILHRGTFCTTSLQATFQITAPADFQDTPVVINIFPTNSTIANDCTTLNIQVTARNPRTVFLHGRGRSSGVACAYAYVPAKFAGSLQLDSIQNAQEVIRFSNGLNSSSVRYSLKQIPIQVYSVFPSNAVFQTTEKVAYRITSPSDNCGSVRNGLGSLTANVGVYRIFQALPGTVKLLGLDADISGGSGPYIYSLPATLPSFSNTGAPLDINCKVVINTAMTPRNCVPDSREKSVTASSTKKSFDFVFIYTCDGVTPVPTIDVTEQTPTTEGSGTEGTVTPTTPTGSQHEQNLVRGWNFFTYNGSTGSSPQSFLSPHGSKILSIWGWDDALAKWKGYQQGSRNDLTALTQSQRIALYVVADTTITIRPANLLSPVGIATTISIRSGLNLIAYEGPTKSVGSAFNSLSITSVHRWNNATQSFESYYRDQSKNTTLDVIKHGEYLYVFSSSSTNVIVTY